MNPNARSDKDPSTEAPDESEVQGVSLAGLDPIVMPQATLVLGYDRRPESQDALQVAVDMARRLSAQLHVVHAIDLDDYPIDPESADWDDQARLVLAGERAVVASVLGEHSTGWTYQAGHGDPATFLVAVADEHDAIMIIVGSRGEGWRVSLERLLSPSVSHRLINDCQRPVLVVSHPRGADT
jgi:nucleotide-binding universal stress UspA family protein